MASRCYGAAFFLLLFLGCEPSQPRQEAGHEGGVADSIKVTKTEDTLRPVPVPEDEAVLNRLDYDTTQWADIALLDPTIHIDMRYATEDNFVREKMYPCGRCFLRPEVARRVVAAHRELQQKGLGLKMLDCYRPHSVQWKLWEKMPDRRYVSDPRKGSMHNRGAAVDLTLADSAGRELDMGTPYDYFGPEAHPSCRALPDSVLARRELLRDVMARQGFKPIRTEWWHFFFGGKTYDLSEVLWKCY